MFEFSKNKNIPNVTILKMKEVTIVCVVCQLHPAEFCTLCFRKAVADDGPGK